jgi:hypothetical protein
MTPQQQQFRPYFGRAWQFKLTTGTGTVTLSSNPSGESLRASFKVSTQLMAAYSAGELTIWNLNPQTAASAVASGSVPTSQLWQFYTRVQRGDTVVISAGYRQTSAGAFSPEANVIYVGNVLQPIWTRESVVDWRLTLRCTFGFLGDALNYANVSLPSNVSYFHAVQQIMDKSGLTAQNETSIDQAGLSSILFPRAQVHFGRPYDLLAEIARDNNMLFWVSPHGGGGGVNLRQVNFDPNTAPDWAYSPPGVQATMPNGVVSNVIKQTIIGTPEQTQDGLDFRVEMDAQPLIGDTVGLAPGTLVNPFPISQGVTKTAALNPIPNRAGVYLIIGLSYVGDTRGQDWYTEIHAVTSNFWAQIVENDKSAPPAAN